MFGIVEKILEDMKRFIVEDRSVSTIFRLRFSDFDVMFFVNALDFGEG